VAAVTFLSTNPGKAREVAEVLRPYDVDVRWRRRDLPEPQAETLEEVVRAKLDASRGVKGTALVEDSGLFIPALGGFPGVYSAHFLRIWRFEPIFRLLRGRDRRAYFRTVAGVRNGSKRAMFAGEVWGHISARPAGRHGFGYDPIFVPRGWDRTFAEVPSDSKNTISHRARAIRKVGEALASGRFP
jgi:XTP/dITP diphosphohydrolase